MKKITLIVILLSSLYNYSQNKIAQKVKELQSTKTNFKPISVLSISLNNTDSDVNKVVDKSTLATIKLQSISEIITNKYENIELEIPYQNQIIKVLLYQENPFSEGFHVDTDKNTDISYQKGVYYRGIIKGEVNSIATFNFFNGEFNGVISSDVLGNLVVGKLVKDNNTTDYIVYSDANMKILNSFECHVKEDPEYIPNNSDTNRNTLSNRCVTMYFEIDYNLFLANGSSTVTTTNWITSVFNNVRTLYENDGITISLRSLFIWTELDPYQSIGTNSGAYLDLFNQVRPFFDGDVGQLVGVDPGGLGGVARTINGLCTANNYSYSDINFSFSAVPNYSWTINVIAHEFGHLLGSRHTHGCYWNGDNTSIDGCGQQAGFNEGSCATGPIPTATEKGTIMSYCHLISGVGINFNNGFGTQPAQAIVNAVDNGQCLSLDCVSACINSITAINTNNLSPTSVLITWDSSNIAQTSWEVSVTPFASSTFVWNTVTSNSFTATGLTPNTYYKIRIRPFCSGLTAVSRVLVFATSVNDYCANTPFTDAGGSGNYSNNESWTRTMIPSNPGLKIKVTFTSFNLELNYDYLYIYNGPDETYGDLTFGGLTGSISPGPYTSSTTNGSLTFKFYSDQAINASGWNATITCTGTFGIEENDIIDFSYYPNPTNGNVNITSKTEIVQVEVFNITGQLLYKNTLNELNTNVDISAFAIGTYFFKLKFEGDKEANFKIIRK